MIWQLTAKALIYYDYSLTWTREVKYFWRKKFTFSTALYIACRYSLVANILYALAINNKLKFLRVSSSNSRAHPELLTTFGTYSAPSTILHLLVDDLHLWKQLRRSIPIMFCLERHRKSSHSQWVFFILPNWILTWYQAVWGARTYAVFNGNKWVLALFGSLGLAVIILGAVSHKNYRFERICWLTNHHALVTCPNTRV